MIDLGTSESSENAAAWTDQDGPGEVFRRVEPNLVLLPTGNVLAVGGREEHRDNSTAEKRPQVWDASNKRWTTPAMAEHESSRGYHSTAILLPDARVISLGGNRGSSDHIDEAEVFEPPYLFDLNAQSQEIYAARPKILTAPAVIQPGTPFTITTDRPATLVSAALVRPGATTHALDQNQRFVPCTPQRIGTTNSVQITPTANSNVLPPGDWMLFIVDNVSPNATTVPSRAAWVRVGGTSGPEPTTVSDLQVYDYACTWAEVRWSAPRPDAGLSCGKATEYEIRYKTSPMNDLDSFQGGTPVPSPPTPGAPGTLESVTLTNLQETATYYVRMRAKNAAGLWSALSNQVSFTMWQCGGSGGGGDPGEILPGPNAMLSTSESDTTYLENTLFARLGRYERRTDRLRLPHGPKWSGDTARVRVSRSGAGGLHVHAVRLLTLDHALADEAFAAETGPVPASRLLPASVTHADGRELTADLASGAQPFEGRAGDIVRAQFAFSASGRVFLRVSRPELLAVDDTMGIDVNVLQDGTWQTLARVSPRELESDEVVALPAHSELQLVFRGTHRLYGVGRLAAPAEAGSLAALSPVAATHSVRGDAMAELGAGDVTLAGGEHLIADFLPPAETPGRERTWFLEVEAEEFWSVRHPGGEGRSRPDGGATPIAFALHASRPNPTRAGVVIPFDLPRSARVELEVFDLQGRRVHRQVATLAAGHHEWAWSLIGERGTAVPTGMYAYRLTAGGFRTQRKMVVVR